MPNKYQGEIPDFVKFTESDIYDKLKAFKEQNKQIKHEGKSSKVKCSPASFSYIKTRIQEIKQARETKKAERIVEREKDLTKLVADQKQAYEGTLNAVYENVAFDRRTARSNVDLNRLFQELKETHVSFEKNRLKLESVRCKAAGYPKAAKISLKSKLILAVNCIALKRAYEKARKTTQGLVWNEKRGEARDYLNKVAEALNPSYTEVPPKTTPPVAEEQKEPPKVEVPKTTPSPAANDTNAPSFSSFFDKLGAEAAQKAAAEEAQKAAAEAAQKENEENILEPPTIDDDTKTSPYQGDVDQLEGTEAVNKAEAEAAQQELQPAGTYTFTNPYGGISGNQDDGLTFNKATEPVQPISPEVTKILEEKQNQPVVTSEPEPEKTVTPQPTDNNQTVENTATNPFAGYVTAGLAAGFTFTAILESVATNPNLDDKAKIQLLNATIEESAKRSDSSAENTVTNPFAAPVSDALDAGFSSAALLAAVATNKNLDDKARIQFMNATIDESAKRSGSMEDTSGKKM